MIINRKVHNLQTHSFCQSDRVSCLWITDCFREISVQNFLYNLIDLPVTKIRYEIRAQREHFIIPFCFSSNQLFYSTNQVIIIKEAEVEEGTDEDLLLYRELMSFAEQDMKERVRD